MDTADTETPNKLLYEGLEGVMSCLQVLVICLGKSGHLDTAEYTRLLAEWRLQEAPPESITEALIDRMLAMLVDEPEVLLRRMSMQLLPGSGDEQQTD
ncbi:MULTISPECIES: hypothetical protein [unclassified Serratia (in: enterobacteria)]|uniref:hypothetical protein n=1 Tax=unclassified Serratia (in: enterobacteria) TaxID=2647522 RepID=UPI0005032790|nr:MULTISPECIES: hypothetical protein [unclassified Serratia (in: enterobacteria)]KFK92775.1 hypothetical protein JV45_19375 [Serratia sp. Ag2]KFK98557.1 hypothetical protein IV04_11915 [Serratia sp. Ag1]